MRRTSRRHPHGSTGVAGAPGTADCAACTHAPRCSTSTATTCAPRRHGSRGGARPPARPLDIAAPAVRTAVSRMVRQGWLDAGRAAAGGPGYALTPEGRPPAGRRGAARLPQQRPRSGTATGTCSSPRASASRTTRQRLDAQLPFLGYAAGRRPHVGGAAAATPDADGPDPRRGRARRSGSRPSTRGRRPARVGDRHGRRGPGTSTPSARRTSSGSTEADPAARRDVEPPSTTRRRSPLRSELVHGWRKFLFRDPGLPRLLLPDGLAGRPRPPTTSPPSRRASCPPPPGTSTPASPADSSTATCECRETARSGRAIDPCPRTRRAGTVELTIAVRGR